MQTKTAGMRLDQYLRPALPRLQPLAAAEGHRGRRVTVNDAAAKASYKVRHGDQRPHLAARARPRRRPSRRTSRSRSSTRTSTSPSSTSRPTWSSTPPRATGRGTLVNALQFHFGQLSDAQRRLPARHRPPPRPRHQRRHPRRQGGADAPRPEHAVRDTARSSRSTSPSPPGVLDRDSDYIERRIGHHPHDRVKMAVDRRRGRGRQGRVHATTR